VQVPAGAELGPGSTGPRVAALRTRLGAPGGREPYDAALADAVARFQRAHGLAETGRANAATVQALNAGPRPYEQALAGSLERARALPPSLGKRYIVVDAAAGELTYFERGR